MLIRQATREDVSDLLLLQKCWEEEGITYGYIADDVASIQAKIGPYLLVAEVGGRIVGFASGTIGVSDGLAVIPSGEPYFEIVDVYVKPSMRDRQIGGKLVERLIEVAKGIGLKKALVYSATKDVRRILSFYEDHGFKSWYVQMYSDL